MATRTRRGVFLRVPEMLQQSEIPRPEYSRRDVAAILLQRATLDQSQI